MHCTHCGKEITPNTRFCPSCGTPVPGSSGGDPNATTGSTTWQAGGRVPPPPPGSYPAPPPRPELLRPRTGRMVAGVCAAFARTYGWNLSLTRILLVVLTPLHLGLGVIAYIIAWIIIPEEPYLLPSGSR